MNGGWVDLWVDSLAGAALLECSHTYWQSCERCEHSVTQSHRLAVGLLCGFQPAQQALEAPSVHKCALHLGGAVVQYLRPRRVSSHYPESDVTIIQRNWPPLCRLSGLLIRYIFVCQTNNVTQTNVGSQEGEHQVPCTLHASAAGQL